MIKVELALYDSHEIDGFNNFYGQLEAYRTQNARLAAAQAQGGSGETAASAAAPEAEVTATTDTAGPVAPVIASITPEGAVKAPKESDMHEAAQKYMNAHGLDKALALVREIGGVARLTEVTDPKKLAELHKRFVEGVK